MNIIIVSHRRSGTHLAIDSILNSFDIFNKKYFNLDRLLSYHPKRVSTQEFKRLTNNKNIIFKTHCIPDIDSYFENNEKVLEIVRNLFENSKIIYILRDGKDVLTSLYYFMKRGGLIHKISDNILFSDFIRMDNEFEEYSYDGKKNRIEFWKYHVEGWLNNPKILYLSFERLKLKNYEEVQRIGNFIEIEPNHIKNIVKERMTNFSNKFIIALIDRLTLFYNNRIKRKVMTAQQFRKGVIGDYKNHFSSEDIKLYNELTEDLYIEINKKYPFLWNF